MRRIIAIIAAMLMANPCFATSAIDGTVPAANATLSSSPIRANFLAAYNEITALQTGKFTGVSGSGMLAVTSGSGATVRTLTGTTNQITITNGDGQSGAPTFSLPNPLVLPGSLSGTTLTASTSVSTPTVTTASGDETIGAFTGNVRVGTGSVPTIASGACGSGSNGTIAAASRSNAGTVQIGSAATTTCTVVFATAMTTAPACIISASDATAIGALVLPYVSANTVNGFVITGSVLANANFNYVCL